MRRGRVSLPHSHETEPRAGGVELAPHGANILILQTSIRLGGLDLLVSRGWGSGIYLLTAVDAGVVCPARALAA